MAKAVAARQFGDEYQQLVFWKYALRMLSGNYEIDNIRYEDDSVKSYDDVVIEYDKPQVFRNTTISILVRDHGVKNERKTDLKKLLLFFDEVDTINLTGFRWDMLRYQRNNKNYEMLMNVCYFVLDGMLQTTEKGSFKMGSFSDKHMHRLYEKFILEYFKHHHSYLTEVRPAQVSWDLAPDTDERMIRFLPIMQTDIFLRYKEQILIIDAKYYGKTMQVQYDKATLHSGNMYQIFTYVKNQDTTESGNVSGMLLYAKTDEAITPDCRFVMGVNRISVKTLDLSKDFKLIGAQLDRIAEEHFGKQGDSLPN